MKYDALALGVLALAATALCSGCDVSWPSLKTGQASLSAGHTFGALKWSKVTSKAPPAKLKEALLMYDGQIHIVGEVSGERGRVALPALVHFFAAAPSSSGESRWLGTSRVDSKRFNCRLKPPWFVEAGESITARMTDATGRTSATSKARQLSGIDLSVTQSASPLPYSPKDTGGVLTFTLRLSASPSAAPHKIVINDVLPTGAAFISASAEEGVLCDYREEAGTLRCEADVLNNTKGGWASTIALRVRPTLSSGPLPNQAWITGDAFEAAPMDNVSGFTVEVGDSGATSSSAIPGLTF